MWLFFAAIVDAKLGDAKSARRKYDEAVKGHGKTKLDTHERLKRFQTEAAEALGVKK